MKGGQSTKDANKIIAILKQTDLMLEESFDYEVWDEFPEFEYAMAA